MGNKYMLEHKNESKRLDYQNSHPFYRLEDELTEEQKFACSKAKILDAGCGNADYARLLIKNSPHSSFKVDAYDGSKDRLKEAEKRAEAASCLERINFILGDLEKLPVRDEYYHRIFTRFTFQHLASDSHQLVANEYYRALKPNGELIVVDADGVLLDIESEDEKFQEYLNILKQELPINLYICQSLEEILSNAGFLDVKVSVQEINFKSAISRMFEMQAYGDRAKQIRPTLLDIFKSEAVTDDFINRLLDQIENPRTKVCYKKYIFCATK